MSNETSNSAPQWQCVSCNMTLPKAPSVPFCPYCYAPKPGTAYTWEQAAGPGQPPAIGSPPPVMPHHHAAPYDNVPIQCRFCRVPLLPDTEGCISCGAPMHLASGYHQFQGGPAYVPTPDFRPGTELGPATANHDQQGQQEYQQQMYEQQMQILQQPGMQQMFAQWFLQQQLQRQQQQPQEPQQPGKQDEATIAAQSRQKAQQGKGNAQHIICCDCGAVFNPDAKLCASCGRPPPRSQPTAGPPCFYCQKLLIKPDATTCAGCSRRQPKRTTQGTKSSEAPTPGATSLPPGLFQQQSSSSHAAPAKSPTAIAETIFSPQAPAPQPSFNFPMIFGTPYPSFALQWPRFPVSPQSNSRPQQGVQQQYAQRPGIETMSSPIQEQTPTSSNIGVLGNVPPHHLSSVGHVELQIQLPDVPGTARPSKGTPDSKTISSSKDQRSGGNMMLDSPPARSTHEQSTPSDPILSSEDHTRTQESAVSNVTKPDNKNDQRDIQATDRKQGTSPASPNEGDKHVTTMPTTTTASSSIVTTTASVRSRTITVNVATKTTGPPSYAGIVKGHEGREDKFTSQKENHHSPTDLPNYNTDGLKSSDPKTTMEITFHAIVPLACWEWENKSHMHIRFGHKKLGHWKVNCGDFETRKIDDIYCEMSCTFHNFDGKLLDLNAGIPYKYVIYSTKMVEEDDCFEFLHAHKSDGNVNRCLMLSKYTEVYHKYDTIVYPKTTKVSPTLRERFTAALMFWKRSSNDEEEFIPLDLLKMNVLCLNFYLEKYKTLVCHGSFQEGHDIIGLVNEISHIFESLSRFRIHSGMAMMAQVPNLNDFREKLKSWLTSILMHIEENPLGDPGKQLTAAFFILLCLAKVYRLHQQLPNKFIVSLIRMLTFNCEMVAQSKCPDYEFLMTFLQNKVQKRSDVHSAVKFLIRLYKKMAETKNLLEWMTALPLYHFLNDQSCKPFGKLSTETAITWDEVSHLPLGLKEAKLKANELKSFVLKYYEDMKPYIHLDPLLSLIFVYLTPDFEFPSLCEKFQPSLTAHKLQTKVAKLNGVNKEQEKSLSADIQCVINSVVHENDASVLLSVSKSSVLIFENFTRMKSSSEHIVTLLSNSIGLILHTIARLDAVTDEESGWQWEDRGNILDSIEKALRSWIADKKVIGGSMFGGSVPSYGNPLAAWKSKGKIELQIWNTLLSNDVPSTSRAMEDWNAIIRQLICSRICSESPELKIEIVCMLADFDNLSPLLADLVMEAGYHAIDILFDQPQYSRSTGFETLATHESVRVGMLLGHILTKKYPDASDIQGVLFSDLLKWHMWPIFITIFVSKPILREGIPTEYHVAGICAQSCLEGMCENLRNGEITVQDLQMVREYQEQMKRLCLAVSSSDERTDLYTCVKGAVEKRLEECNAVNIRREVLSHLCHFIRFVNQKVKGLTELEADLRRDFKTQAINTLCVRNENDNIQLACFMSAKSLLKFAGEFQVVSGSKYGNDIFSDFWRNAMVHASTSHPELTLDDIYSLVWQPCIQQCKQLLQSLMDLSMKLSDVDLLLAPHKMHLETQLHSLLKGVSEIMQKSADSSLIDTANERIRNYWNLREYQKGADIFLRLKKSLGLRGEFRQVEKLSQQLSASMEDQTLQDVDDSLIDTGKFLQDIAKDPRKVECLEKFAKYQKIVKWLKEVTKDVNEIQNFVNVALATAAGGEGDLQHDRLSHLRTVGSGFASLIYSDSDDAGFFELKKACTSVWEALNKNPNLPMLLEECDNDIEWYQSVKETQGSVEVTSYGQMRNILRYGYCQVCIPTQPKSIHSIHDLISLKLILGDKKLPKTSYNLDELRDLESKLVLITGSKAENRTEVDHYLNILQHITRIAEVLLCLQQAGNVTYSGWTVTFYCATYKVIGHGQKQELHLQEETAKQRVDQLCTCAKHMEDVLKEWENEVKESRSRHYELNYYTTLQMLKLRKELGLLQHNPGKSIDPEILGLLESISPNVSSESVHNVMADLKDQLLDLQATANLIPEKYFGEGTELGIHVSDSAPMESGSICSDTFVMNTGPVTDTLSALSISSLTSNKKRTANANPQLQEKDLNDDQKEIFTDLVEYQGYSKFLVLKALEESNESANQYDIQDWCDEHDGIFKFDEEGEDHQEDELIAISESSSDSGSDNPNEDQGNVFNQDVQSQLTGSSPSFVKHQTSPAVISPTVKIVHKQIINESHPIVQQLVDVFEYNLADSIEAVQLLGTQDRAVDYLASKDAENSNEEDVTPPVVTEPTPEERENIVIFDDPEAEEKYLSLDQLGVVLGKLNQQLPEFVRYKRTFNEELKPGCPNLIIASCRDILKIVLTLYMDDKALPLPTLEEVLICTTTTTAEEVNLLWQRAVGDPDYKRIFCLVHAEKLSYQICDEVVETLKQLSQGKQWYRLVIVCSKETGSKPHIVSKLLLHEKSIVIKPNDIMYQEYLKDHFTDVAYCLSSQAITQKASVVDHENSCVRVVSSERTGMGKSLFIQRMAEKLSGIVANVDPMHCEAMIPIHGPVVTPDVVMQFLKKHYKDDKCIIYHFDIAPNILSEVDTILFSLLILRGLTDSQGRVWRCHPGQLYAIEVTLPRNKGDNPESRTVDLLSLLPTVECLSPNQVFKMATLNPSQIGIDNNEFRSSTFQRVYQYLRRHASGQKLDQFRYQKNVEGTTTDCLHHFLKYCGVQNPSWSEVHHFAKFLNLQLESCEKSVFCDESFVGDVMSGLKGFVVKFMIRMSRDFATPSLQCEVTRVDQEDQSPENNGNLQQYTIEDRRKWEESSHPYIFFNDDGISITFVGFIITSSGDLVDPRRTLLEARIMTPQLYKGLVRQKVNFADDYQTWKKTAMIEKLCMVMGVDFNPEKIYDPDETYVLTVDNLIKILAIQMRFRCGIPVVIMGETGCGKTRLIRYMCDLAKAKRKGKNMLILKVHGGIKEEEIIDFINMAENVAKENKENSMDTVVFFDEANTTDAIGLIKEIMCDRRIHGRPVSMDLKFIAACNPYRRHSEEMIDRLKEAGLGFYVEASKTKQKLGHIPLRELVYRVFDLPPSMRPLVYDFGQLKKGTEDEYIKQIVSDHVKKHSALSKESPAIILVIAKVLATSQAYMREQKDECSFVSLRDIERAMIVFEYFCEKMPNFRQADKQRKDGDKVSENEHPSDITSALILSLSVCYHSRLQERDKYERIVSLAFGPPLALPEKNAQFKNEITWCQNVLLDNMMLGPNIAKNAALRENVFMMAICIELRIPLFLVGKPGSSKSLAKSIIQDSMHGKASRTELLRSFKQVHMFSYQCSQLATSESVIDVFKSAKKFQSKQDITQYVSVVVLDEVGLAEDSPNLPLKALHPLLEDGTEGAGAEGNDEIIDRDERVAFIGISNWALDPAKMNRGVMVTRGTPDITELEFSAKGICGKENNDQIRRKLDPYFTPLAKAYQTIYEKQKREFFGLRDFYSLIKMLYWMCKESRGLPLTWPQMKHAIMRNFGGLKTDKLNPFEEFRVHLNMSEVDPNPNDYQDVERIWPIISPDNSRLGLIKTSLGTRETSFHGENRYLLFLTENYAALDILEHYIRGKEHDRPELSSDTNKPFTIFGSSFPKDKEYTQVCRNINQIKICMETGRTVILLNLENLYESLYDVLNQYYMHYGDSRYVDLGLQTHRVKCRVHNDFKLILIAERDRVYDMFPTPLINRLEKHFVLTSSVLEDWQQEVLQHFQLWISQFSQIHEENNIDKKKEFKESHAFIGYQEDTPAAVVFQASQQLKKLSQGVYWRKYLLKESGTSPDELGNEQEGSDTWIEVVLRLSQYLLLQMASDDAIVRLKNTTLADQQEELMQLYLSERHHNSIINFVQYHMQNDVESQEGLLLQVTTHGHLLLQEELENILNMNVESFLLQEFDTELDFSNKVGPLFQRDKGDDCLLVIQCDSGHMNGDLIACARHRIYDVRVKALDKEDRGGVTHVLFIINLPHQVLDSSFVGFQGDPWISAHIDDLRPTSGDTIDPLNATSATMSELFIGGYIHDIGPLLGGTTNYLLQQTPELQSEESFQEENETMTNPLFTFTRPHAEEAAEMEDEEIESDLDIASDDNEENQIEEDVYAGDSSEYILHAEESKQDSVLPKALSISSEPLTTTHEEVLEEQSEDTLTVNQMEAMVIASKPTKEMVVIDIEEDDIEYATTDIQQESTIQSVERTSCESKDKMVESGEHDDHQVVQLTLEDRLIEDHERYQIPEPSTYVELGASPFPVTTEETHSFKEKRRRTKDQRPSGQCRRLHNCIQAAASKLEDSTKDRSTQRVTRLTKLIKRCPDHLDHCSFHGILVMHIYRLIQEREADRLDLTNWVLREALDASKLEVGGTFRNVLARKIDEVVVKVFANIIACIDRDYNLDLINPKVPESPLSQFWLAMFKEPKIQQFRYSDMDGEGGVPGLGKRKLVQDFKCQLPFFWLVKDAVDSQWDNAKSQAGVSMRTHHEQLCEFVRDTPVGAVLESVHAENVEEFYKLYLQDYVKSVHKCKHRSIDHNITELRLVSDALDHIVHCSEFQHHSLTSMIAALHLAYEMNKSQILCFNQLVSHSPSIMYSLIGAVPSKEFKEMELHLYAAEKMIEKLEPPLQKDNPNPNLLQWLNHIRLSQSTIVSILSLKSCSGRANKARHCWWRLRATQLFVELVMLKHPEVDLKLLARRLCARWKGSCDFLTVSTVNAVQLQLSSVEKLLKKDCDDKNKIKEVKKSCRGFFMEMVSNLCFKGQAAPEPDLIKMLLNTVFMEKDQLYTQELTPYKDDKVDKIPTVRSFLLQLLLEHSMEHVRDHLREYLDRSYRVLGGSSSQAGVAESDQDLYLLIIQCFEDALCKKISTQIHIDNIEEVTAILIEGYNGLQEYRCGTPTLEYLEGVAKARYSLSVVAEVIKNTQSGHHFKELLRAAGRMCSDCEINRIDPTGRKDTVGPVIYLLKLIVRQYGMPCLKAAAEIHEWLIPAQLKSNEEKSVDPFIIYGDLYKSLRGALNDAIYGNQTDALDEATPTLKSCEVPYFLLALYEKATLSRTTDNPASRINDDALERLNHFVMNYQLLSNELRFTARALLANQQGGRILEQMSVSPQQPLQCRTVLGVVVHAAAVFFGRQKIDVLLPFVNILNNPALLNQSYLPTMQEDPLLESQAAMVAEDNTGKFYECPNGHRYFVGNCGQTYSTGVCNVCKAPIGGTSGNPLTGNKLTTTQDTTKKGHDLGAPENRTHATPERKLSARAVCILRALMHSAFVWTSCNNEPALEAIASLVTPQVLPQNLPEFFWAHLEKDLELLGRDTGKGLDEVVMIVHLVLRHILTTDPPIGGTVQTVSSLDAKEARKEWERIFNQHYIQPVLSTLDENLAIAMDHVANDEQQDHDQLFYLVYEKVKYTEECLEPHLWTYRSRITLEHLRQTLQEKKMKERYTILHEFLQAEAKLRATQYLPDIARLQQCLYDRFNRQIDRKDVKKQTIQAFIKELPNETIKNEYREMISSVKAAWALVGHKLKNHGRLPVEEKFYVAVIDDNTQMEYLVPTTSEAGVCTTALVDFLTLTHNNFIERCRALVAKNDQSTLSFWREHKVPITHLHRCHLLDYEHQLPSIILSHCHYSLKVGKGQDVKYDHQALEKHVLNRFIHGKPLILLDIPQVVYRKDIYTTGTFADVRKKVEPQEKLQQRIRQDIVAELRTPDRLREALDVVEIVLGFLSSGGGKADKPLGEYIDKTLKMKKRRFSQKAKSSCQLKHALSLWETIAVELARQLCLRGQEPFDSIRKEFLCELSKDEDRENQFEALDRCLGQFDPDLLLGTLYEFIETYVKHCPLHEHDQPLVVTLKLVLEQYGTKLPQLAEFPASIKLDQAVAAWKHIVHYYATRH